MRNIVIKTCIFFFLISICTYFNNVCAYQTKGEEAGKHVTWSYDKKTHTLTFSGKGKMYTESWYGDYDEFETEWDHLSNKVEKVVFEKGITYVGFHCCQYMPKLKKVKFASTITSIGEGAFMCCPKLSKITFPKKLRRIGVDAFMLCDLKTIHLPKKVSKIGDGAFFGCGVKKINYPKSLKEIPSGIYYGSNMKEFTVPKHIKKIAPEAFENCTKLKKINFNSNLEEIGFAAFEGCVSLKTIKLPKKLKKIRDNAFMDCKRIRSVTIPENVEILGGGSFVGCDNLENFNVKSKKIKKFERTHSGKCTENIKTISVPEGTTGIGNVAFSYDTIEKVVIASSVKSMDWNAFYGTPKLNEIFFYGNNLEKVDKDTFVDVRKECMIYVPQDVIDKYKILFYKGGLNKEVQVIGY